MLLAVFCLLVVYFLGLSLALNNLKRDKAGEIRLRKLQKIAINEKRKILLRNYKDE
jgi:hypothetical protein